MPKIRTLEVIFDFEIEAYEVPSFRGAIIELVGRNNVALSEPIVHYTFEIGGKSKTKRQIEGLKNVFIVKDYIEYGYKNVLPLWLFGFLYFLIFRPFENIIQKQCLLISLS